MEFYGSIFGWKFIRENYVTIEYYSIEIESINGGLLKRPAKVPSNDCGMNVFVCSIQVSDFDETGKLIIYNGGQIVFPKFAIPGRCWQGYFIDLDNNTFGMFEVDDKTK